MPALVAADVTYAEKVGTAHAVAGARSTGRQRLFNLTFGDGAKTYPTGGIPLVKANLACPTFVKRLRVLGDAEGDPVWSWNGSDVSPTLIGEATTAPPAQTILVEVEGY